MSICLLGCSLSIYRFYSSSLNNMPSNANKSLLESSSCSLLFTFPNATKSAVLYLMHFVLR